MLKKRCMSIDEARIDCGYTIQEASAYVEISVEELELYESNFREVPYGIAIKLLRLYKVSFSTICFD